MKNPFNTQEATLYLSHAGDMVTGKMESRNDISEIKDVKLEDDILTWKASRKILTFEFNAKIDGDTMSSTVKSRLGKATLKGTRIARNSVESS